jgi:hypothetical protein
MMEGLIEYRWIVKRTVWSRKPLFLVAGRFTTAAADTAREIHQDTHSLRIPLEIVYSQCLVGGSENRRRAPENSCRQEFPTAYLSWKSPPFVLCSMDDGARSKSHSMITAWLFAGRRIASRVIERMPGLGFLMAILTTCRTARLLMTVQAVQMKDRL